MITYKGFDIQQNNANRYDVIRVDDNGIRRSYYEAQSIVAAEQWIRENCIIVELNK